MANICGFLFIQIGVLILRLFLEYLLGDKSSTIYIFD